MEDSAALLAAATPHDLLRRQNAAVRHHHEQAARVGDSHDHAQRSLERYVQDLVCQLGELSIVIPPRLTGAVSESTPDDLRVVLEGHILRMRQEIDQLTQPAADPHSAASGRTLGSIPMYLQELHALKQQSLALREQKSRLQDQLQRVREQQQAALARQASSNAPDPASANASRYNSLKINTVTSPVSNGVPQNATPSSSVTAASAVGSDFFSAGTGSSEVLRRTLEPQQVADFDSPRIESRARSLFSPTTDDVGKASSFSSSVQGGFGSEWNDVSSSGVAQPDEGASWGAFASREEVATSSDIGGFETASATTAAWSDDAESFGKFVHASEKRPESPSLLVFSPSGLSSAPKPDQTTSRFFGDDSFASSTKSIMDLYPATATGHQGTAAPAFDVFSFAEDVAFSALDAGNEIDWSQAKQERRVEIVAP
ncbi:hypothetical protein Gpo141_00014128 [Globisporangium polare]